MNSRFAVLGIGLLLAGAAQVHAQAIQLRFTPPVGQVTHYRMVNRTWTSADTSGTPTVQASMYQTQTVLAMDGPNYVVKTTFDSTVVAGGGAGRPGPGGDMMRGMAVTVHQDSRGNIISREVTPPPGLPPFIANMMTKNSGSTNGANTRVWPDAAISPGYTWTDSIPMSIPAGHGRPKQLMCRLTWKFERVDHEAGARVAIFSVAGNEGCTVTGEMAFNVDASRLAHMTMDMTSSSTDAPGRIKTNMETLP